MSLSSPTDELLPPCPITGQPPLRRIQRMSRSLIADLWRIGQIVNVDRLFQTASHFDMYESPTGLIYFEPPIVGDSKFYEDYYARWEVHRGLNKFSKMRGDFLQAAKHIMAGSHVIDVGCGPGVFRHHIPYAKYTGLDPFAADDQSFLVRATLKDHVATHANMYDVATAFHVIEHVADPREHFELMVRLIKPGGLVVLAAPLYPSLLSEIPNFPINMPPHHVTWWNPNAFRALAAEFDMEVIEASALPASPHQGQIVWLHRLLARRTDPPPNDRYYAHRWSWHASLAIAYVMSKVAVMTRQLPPNAGPVDAFLVARKA